MRRIMAFLIVMCWATVGFACDNDSELPIHEREFRSQYGEDEIIEPSPSPASAFTQRLLNPTLLGTGASLVVGAFFLSANGRRPKE